MAPPGGWNLEEEKILPNRFPSANNVQTILNGNIGNFFNCYVPVHIKSLRLSLFDVFSLYVCLLMFFCFFFVFVFFL